MAGGDHTAARGGAVVEASAPCRIELLGGSVGSAGQEDAGYVAVALDRRAWCRVETGVVGLAIHSKDTRQSTEVADATAVAATNGPLARVAYLLHSLGVRDGLRVVTELKVPEDAGLGSGPALSVAVLAAVGEATGRRLGRDETAALVQAVEERLAGAATGADVQCALFGGAHVEQVRRGVRTVAWLGVDPARIEECLLLVDPGPNESAAPAPAPHSADLAERLAVALRAGRYSDVGEILTEPHTSSVGTPPGAVAEVVRRAGGVAWACGRLVAAWASPGTRGPGAREVVKAAIDRAGFRNFRARIDLRGLSVE